MAERFFARKVKHNGATAFMEDLISNQGVVDTTITTTPVSEKWIVFTFFNDIPVVTKAGAAVVSYSAGTAEPTWADLVDVTDGDHASGHTLTTDLSAVDMISEGTFDVGYIATDSVGNASELFELEITITADVTNPVISDAETLVVSYVTGSDTPATWMTGITALDAVDGDITEDIVVTDSAVDMVTVGTFAILYNVDDTAGNSATQLSKTITITSS